MESCFCFYHGIIVCNKGGSMKRYDALKVNLLSIGITLLIGYVTIVMYDNQIFGSIERTSKEIFALMINDAQDDPLLFAIPFIPIFVILLINIKRDGLARIKTAKENELKTIRWYGIAFLLFFVLMVNNFNMGVPLSMLLLILGVGCISSYVVGLKLFTIED